MRELLSADEVTTLAADRPEWSVESGAMERTFAFGDFSEAMAFVVRVALAADRIDHHPDIDIRWNKVTLRLSTHSAGGLTGMDETLSGLADGFLTGSRS